MAARVREKNREKDKLEKMGKAQAGEGGGLSEEDTIPELVLVFMAAVEELVTEASQLLSAQQKAEMLVLLRSRLQFTIRPEFPQAPTLHNPSQTSGDAIFSTWPGQGSKRAGRRKRHILTRLLLDAPEQIP